MSKRIFFSVLLILGFTSISLVNDTNEYVKMNKENCKKIINEEVNLIYFFTDWCSFSKRDLIKLYGNDTKINDLNINVILIGTDSKKSDLYIELFKANKIEFPLYVLENKFGISAGTLTDYPRVNRFLKKNFSNVNELPSNRMPLTFFADKNLNVIAKAGRTLDRITEQVTEIKDSLNLNK